MQKYLINLRNNCI